jgi:hypothetical protein
MQRPWILKIAAFLLIASWLWDAAILTAGIFDDNIRIPSPTLIIISMITRAFAIVGIWYGSSWVRNFIRIVFPIAFILQFTRLKPNPQSVEALYNLYLVFWAVGHLLIYHPIFGRWCEFQESAPLTLKSSSKNNKKQTDSDDISAINMLLTEARIFQDNQDYPKSLALLNKIRTRYQFHENPDVQNKVQEASALEDVITNSSQSR